MYREIDSVSVLIHVADVVLDLLLLLNTVRSGVDTACKYWSPVKDGINRA